MPVIDTTHDETTLTLTMIAEFAAPPRRVWEVYADPRQLEAVWGPPGYPATVVDHELRPGGWVTYYMTGPEGERYHGFWEVSAVEEFSAFTFRDCFADEAFTAVESLPGSTNVYSFVAIEGGTRATYVATFDSLEGLRTVLEMGVVEGATAAIGQIDELLAGEPVAG